MCEIAEGRLTGRRDNGNEWWRKRAVDRRTGQPITCDYIKRVLEEKLGEDARITVLGHVQRGEVSPQRF